MAIVRLIRLFAIKLASFFYSKNRSKVIFYHDIHDKHKYTDMSTSLKLFKKHIQIMHEFGYELVSEITKETGQIEICFDDGFIGVYDNINFFKYQNIPFHLFIVSSYVGRENYIDEKQLFELSKLDGIKISSHTYSHKVLNKMDEDQLKSELKNSKEYLEELIDKPVDSICYPEGKFNKLTINISKSIGYKKQYSSLPGFFNNMFLNNVIRRSLVQFAQEEEFKAILKGGDHILAFWYTLKHFSR